jgi:hypothetical protein
MHKASYSRRQRHFEQRSRSKYIRFSIFDFVSPGTGSRRAMQDTIYAINRRLQRFIIGEIASTDLYASLNQARDIFVWAC